jgi:hypothetical protein
VHLHTLGIDSSAPTDIASYDARIDGYRAYLNLAAVRIAV